jgi:hypothetical protein
MTAVRSKPSSPLPPHPSSKAISNVGMTPDYEPAAADAGKAKLEIASTMPRRNHGRYGVAPCRESAALTAAAQGYANWLAYYNRVGHWGDSKARAAAAGFTGTLVGSPTHGGWRGLGEITHHGSRTIYDAFRCWEESDGHRFGMTDPLYDSCGFGYAVNRKKLYGSGFSATAARHTLNSSAPPRQQPRFPAARSAVSYTQPRACPGGVCGQSFYPQRQYVQQPQQWQYQRPGLLDGGGKCD